ncbi:hypothetical protein [Croceimicrobium sp.]|uniref:hypothetical protein n=1 Tax=Croceimicrobium sp. TaxID=2828340 RepID=UPI003BAD3DE7
MLPPSDYFHRNGFSNAAIIESLSDSERHEVEMRLIKMLEESSEGLIGETMY